MNLLRNLPNLVQSSFNSFLNKSLIATSNNYNFLSSVISRNITLTTLHEREPKKKNRKRNTIMEGRPFIKGVVLKTLIKKPRKPNSANRKCVLVRLSTGREVVAYVPGVGHNLQEHNFVLIKGGRVKDLPGIKVKCVRGVYDLPHTWK